MSQVWHDRAKLIGGAALAAMLALATPAVAAAPQQQDDSAAAAPSKSARKLAQLLEGREPGAPVACIPTGRNLVVTAIDGTAYVYGRGDTIYLQRTTDPARIDSTDMLSVRRLIDHQLCRSDRATSIAPFSGVVTGVVFFEDFIPYTRIKPAHAEGG
ncbi:hypothetical protein [Erythrobacter cryptus]|uniref:hypothetical protein n=1 Tax=Erythrobacter cryptus TaxID=196588 RepID=UPI0004261C8C|nr:hypothetical protein [Erythrobacter cryptus]GIX21106.1 MAG: hypothetical protein KatS3mg120_2782 [Erythrobacter sp.]